MFSSLLLAVAVVAHEPGYSTSLANNLRRYLDEEAVAAKVVTPKEMTAALKSERIAFLIGFDRTTAGELKSLSEFCARGGRLVVFHSADPGLAKLMGVSPAGYRAASRPGEFSRIDFAPGALAGAPSRIRQTSGALQRARPIAGRSRTIATWTDREGRPTGESAFIASANGWWMTNVLSSDGDEDLKGQLAAALCGAADARLWSLAAHNEREYARHRRTRALALAERPVAGEIHAVWDHAGTGLYPDDWPRTMKLLRESHVTDLFVNVAGAGFAHYPSSVLPRSRTFRESGDQLEACLAAAKGTGVRVHAWVLCFTAARSEPAVMDEFSRRGWRLKTAKGALTEYLDPALAAVRSRMLSAVGELTTRYPGLSGVHLDFVRYGDQAVKPPEAAATIAGFVREVRSRIAKPRMLTVAVYGKHPQCVKTVAQDWPRWLDAGYVDYVVPMDYTASEREFGELLSSQAARARRTIVGVGVTANESRLDAQAVIRQLRMVRSHGFAGVSLFDLDATLERRILPYLKLGIW